MEFKDKVEPIALGREVKLRGHCVLEAWKDGKLMWRQEHDNTVTPYVAGMINKGNFFNTIPTNKVLPLLKNFAGVQLLSKTGDATKMTIPADADVIACAGDSSYNVSNDDLRRGTFNVDSSGPVVGAGGRVTGYKFVWNWVDTRGNSPDASTPFKAVCLTRPALAVARYDENNRYYQLIEEALKTAFSTTSRLAQCQLIDYDGECAYNITYANSKIVVKKYQLDTKQFHMNGIYNSSSVYDVTAQIGDAHEITPATAPNDYNIARASVSLVGGKIHFITWKNNTIVDNVIDPADDYSVTSHSYTYDLGSGVTIRNLDTGTMIVKDGILLTSAGTDFWLVGSDNKFYRCNLSNTADVSDPYNMPGTTSNGVFAELPNGDWVKYSFGLEDTSGIPVNFYHNDIVYAASVPYDMPAGWGYRVHAININAYGTALLSLPYSGRYINDPYMSVHTFTHYVSTVWNIADDDYIKTAGMDMRCVYILTET